MGRVHGRAPVATLSARAAALVAAGCALAACEEPAEPARIEVVYLLDRINGDPPPQPVCAQGSLDQELIFESIALLDDATYGRLQRIRIDDGPTQDQEERGDVEHTDSTILLINAADDTLTLTLLDGDDAFVERIHTCGDTLRYDNTPVVDS